MIKPTNLVKLNSSCGKIRYVVHLSNIHIHRQNRHKEYREVFDTLFVSLKAKKFTPENSCVIIIGDIVNDKDILTPESVGTVNYLFEGLCKITTVLYILGNHDINNNNEDAVDCITPVASAHSLLRRQSLSRSNNYF
jgi:predicted MPP superfamily phosphohydrolase